MSNHEVVRSELEPGDQVGAWRVVRTIGRGGMSEVFEVEHGASRMRAALKVLHRDVAARARTMERFALEGRVLQDLRHRGVPEILESGCLADGLPFLVMELVRGVTLAEVLQREVPDRATSLQILEQLCDVLDNAHARGVVHRDIKPDNIILIDGDELVVKLLDWGIAKRLDDHGTPMHLTSTGAIVGTPRYLAPEQARSEPVDARTDVYALGLLAYELLLGVYPFQAESLGDMLLMQMIKPPPAPRRYWPEIPAALERMLLSMLAKDPSHRPALSSVHDVLRAALSGADDTVTPESMMRGDLDRTDTIADVPPVDRATSRWRPLRR